MGGHIPPEATSASPSTAFVFAALSGLGMLVGIWVMRRFETWALRHTAELIAFAAGLLVTGALLHLVDRAIRLVGPGTGLSWTLAAFVGLYLVEAHVVPHVHARGEVPLGERVHGARRVGTLVVAGLAVHSVVDGLAVGVGLSAGTLIGSITFLLVAVHKLPVGIASMSALYHSGVPGTRAAWISGSLAMVTPITVLLSYFLLRTISPQVLGVLLALAAGSFLYVGAADLLPEGQARGRPANTLLFALGTGVMVAIKLWSG